jgi:hypothetical protein
MDKKLKIALEETEFLDGMIIEGNHFKVAQFLSLREHLLESIKRCEELKNSVSREKLLGEALHGVLVTAGVLNPDSTPTGPMLLCVAEEYMEAGSKAKAERRG